ncbi:MAG: inorganic phosphate transporter [Nitrososphaerales archaeon]
MIDLLLVLLAGALAFIFGWNNSSLLIGNIRASGSLGVKGAVVVSVVGLLGGAVIEGPKMLKSLDGSVASSSPQIGLAITFALAVAFTIGLTFLKLPASFSGIMVGSFLGAATALHLAVNGGQVLLIVAFWFFAPLIAGLIAFGLHRAASGMLSGISLVGVDSFNRVAIVGTSFAVAFVLGANNVGLMAGTAVGGGASGEGAMIAIGMALVAALGAVFLGKGHVSDTIGDRMLSLSPQGVFAVFAGAAIAVIIGTQLQVPMSIGESILGGMFGAAYSQRTTVINRRVASVALGMWIVTPLMAFAAGYLLAAV